MPLYRRSPDGPWWYRFKVGGQTYRASTGTTTRRDAEEVERAARARLEASSTRARGGTVLDLAQLAEWDDARARAEGVTPATVDQLQRNWGHLERVLGGCTEVQRIRYDHLEQYVARRRQEGARGQTIRREVQALRRGLEAARKRGRLRQVLEDWPEVRSDPAHPGKRGKLIPPATLSRWLAELPQGARDQALFALLTGLRAEEVRRVRPEWVERTPSGPTPAVLRLPGEATKTRGERVVGLPAEALEILERGADLAGEHKTAFRLASKRAGWPRTITLRDLRHTHATLATVGTGDAAATQAALGHSDLATTQRYLSSTLERSAGAAAAVARAVGVTPPVSQRTPGVRETKVLSGRGDRIRTCDPLLPKQIDHVVAHILECEWCRAIAAECMSLHTAGHPQVSQGVSHPAPEHPRRRTA